MLSHGMVLFQVDTDFCIIQTPQLIHIRQIWLQLIYH